MSGYVTCRVCGERVPKERTALVRQQVRTKAVGRRSYVYRTVRACQPSCGDSAHNTRGSAS